MQKVRAIKTTVVIGEHVLHTDHFALYPDGAPEELLARQDLVEILDDDGGDTNPLKADGVLKGPEGEGAGTGEGQCPEGEGAGTGEGQGPEGEGASTGEGQGTDTGLEGVSLLTVDDEDDDEGEGGSTAPDPFADDAPPSGQTPAAPPAPAAPPKAGTRTRTSSGRRK